MAVNVSDKKLPPEAQYSAPIDTTTEGAMNGYRPTGRMSQPPFDLDKYYNTAYRNAVANADTSSFGKMASLGDELLSRHGMGLGSDTWVSAINSLNANKRKAYSEASETALTQTVALQQQKFNQALESNNMNLSTFLQLSADNLKRAGSIQESSKLAEAADAAVRGDYQKLQSAIQSLIDMYIDIVERDKDRRAGLRTESRRQAREDDRSKNATRSGILSGLLATFFSLFTKGGG